MADVNIKISVLSQAAENAVKGLGNQTKKTDKRFKALNLRIKNTTSTFKIFAGNLAAKAVSRAAQGLFGLGASALKATQDLETAATQFEVLTGSAETANAVIKDLQEFTARTPFRFQDVAKASQRLLSFGFSVKEVNNRLQDLGDVSAASGSDLGELALIFGQVRAAGKLTGERLLQFQERAIPIGPALAKTMGVAESSIRDLVSKGKVDFDTFESAFRSLNEQGEFAFGGIDKRSKTLQGRISTLKDNFELFAAGIGKRFAPALKAGITALTTFIQSITNGKAFDGFLTTIADNIPRALRFMGGALVNVVGVFNGLRLAINFINGLLFNYIARTLGAAEATLRLVQSTGKFLKIDTAGVDKAIQKIKTYKDAAIDVAETNFDANDKIIQSQKKLEDAVDTGVDLIVTKYNEERTAAEATAVATIDANEKKGRAVQQFASITELFRQQSLEQEAIQAEQEKLQTELAANERFQFLVQNLGQEEAAKAAARAKELEDEGKHQEALKVLSEARSKAEKQARDNSIKLERATARAKVNIISSAANLITAATEDGSKAAFLAQKGAALAQAIVAKELAVVQALATPPAPNLPLASLARGAGNLSIAAIIASTIKGFESGGIVPGQNFSGDNVLARVNSGEMILNRQQQTQLFAQANGQTAGSEQTIIVPVQIDGTEIARVVSKQVANGVVLGEFE